MDPLVGGLLGELERVEGNLEAATELCEHAFALGCQLAVPCLEGAAARVLGLIQADRGNYDVAIDILTDARARSTRFRDHIWVVGWVLDALSETAVEHAPHRAARWVQDLELLAARTGMREFLVLACLHRGRLGDSSGHGTVRLVAAEVDNPALHLRLRGTVELRAS